MSFLREITRGPSLRQVPVCFAPLRLHRCRRYILALSRNALVPPTSRPWPLTSRDSANPTAAAFTDSCRRKGSYHQRGCQFWQGSSPIGSPDCTARTHFWTGQAPTVVLDLAYLPSAAPLSMLVQYCQGIHAQRAPLLSLGSILGHNCSPSASQPEGFTRSSRKHEREAGRRGLAVVGSSSNGSESSSGSNGASPSSKGKRSASGKSLDERILSGEVSGSSICLLVLDSWVRTSSGHHPSYLCPPDNGPCVSCSSLTKGRLKRG